MKKSENNTNKSKNKNKSKRKSGEDESESNERSVSSSESHMKKIAVKGSAPVDEHFPHCKTCRIYENAGFLFLFLFCFVSVCVSVCAFVLFALYNVYILKKSAILVWRSLELGSQKNLRKKK